MTRSSAMNQLLDALANHGMGSKGSTMAHFYIQDLTLYPIKDIREVTWRGRHKPEVVFVPPKAEDRVLMFPDGSGVYAHAPIAGEEGRCLLITPMGNIRAEAAKAGWAAVPQ